MCSSVAAKPRTILQRSDTQAVGVIKSVTVWASLSDGGRFALANELNRLALAHLQRYRYVCVQGAIVKVLNRVVIWAAAAAQRWRRRQRRQRQRVLLPFLTDSAHGRDEQALSRDLEPLSLGERPHRLRLGLLRRGAGRAPRSRRLDLCSHSEESGENSILG